MDGANLLFPLGYEFPQKIPIAPPYWKGLQIPGTFW
jgi:hypothetical protein